MTDSDLLPALQRVLDALEPELDAVTDSATALIFEQLPAYAGISDARFRADVREHVHEHLSTSLALWRAGRPTTREDCLFIRRYAADRVERITVADFISSFNTAQMALWERILELADDEQSRRAVLAVVPEVVQYFAVATTHAAEVYLETEELLATTSERLRRDLLDELVAGTVPSAGPQLEVLTASGLYSERRCLVINATPIGGQHDEDQLRGAASALARSGRSALSPLTVLRREEIVIVMSEPADTKALVCRLEDTQQTLARRGLNLAIGISTVHPDLAAVKDAYREAVAARERRRESGGVLALATMSIFDYVTMRDDDIARRLLPPEVEQFIVDDLADGGVLIETIQAYARADMNVKQTAADLHIHVNTAHYRLSRIAERTRTDPRRVSDVMTLLIAARLGGSAA